MDQDVHVNCPHAMQTLLTMAQAHSVTAARLICQAGYNLQIYSEIIYN